VARNLFGDVVSPSIAVGNRRPYTLPVSILVHAVIVAAAIIVPLRAGGVLPAVAPGVIEFIGAVQPVILPPPPPLRSSSSRSPSSPAVEPDAIPIAAPPSIGSDRNIESPVANVGLVEGNSVGIPGAEALGAVSLVPDQPIAAPAPSAPVPVGGRIERPKIVRQVAPVYPAAARLARVQGTVIIEATIGATGKVEDAKVLRSFPLLDQAALDAVRQWEFTPTMLNGRAIAVLMTVTVDFKLQ
jgi:protein TonB